MTGEEETIFKMHNLTDFEKVLYLEKQMKELLEIAKNRGELVHILKARVEELEDLTKGSATSIKVKNLKRELTAIKAKLRKSQFDFNSIMHKNQELLKKTTNLVAVEFYSVEGRGKGRGKGNLFGTAEGEFWLHRDVHTIDSNKSELTTLKWILEEKLEKQKQ